MKFLILTKKNSIFLLTLLLILIFSICYITNLIFISKNISIQTSSNNIELHSTEEFKKKVFDLINQDEKYAYLTFDDGPTKKATNKILDILKAENVRATFFVLGKHVKENPDITRRAFEEGHYIANHGYSHNNEKLYKSRESFINEIKETDKEISKALGIENYNSHVFRFPNGYMANNYKSKKQKYVKLLENLNYTYIDWNALNKDSEKKYTNSELLNNLKATTKNKGTLVILMHDTNDVNDTTNVLKDSIKYLKEHGYTFKNFYALK